MSEGRERPAATPVAAASLVLLRDGGAGPEVLLLRRSPHARAFAGASVFPGGTVDPSDAAPGLPLAGAPPPAAALGGALTEAAARALAVAALRELFEETRLLLALDAVGRPADPALVARLHPERSRVHAGEASLEDVLAPHGLRLAAGALAPLARWITPESQPRRWDTWFFAARAPVAQEAAPDGHETVEAAWVRPAAALAAYERRERELVPPTYRILEDLVPFATVEDALGSARRRAPPRPVLPVLLPGTPSPTFVYPGDHAYPGAAGGGEVDRLVLTAGRWRSARSRPPAGGPEEP